MLGSGRSAAPIMKKREVCISGRACGVRMEWNAPYVRLRIRRRGKRPVLSPSRAGMLASRPAARAYRTLPEATRQGSRSHGGMTGPESEVAAAAAGRGNLRMWKCYLGRHDYVQDRWAYPRAGPPPTTETCLRCGKRRDRGAPDASCPLGSAVPRELVRDRNSASSHQYHGAEVLAIARDRNRLGLANRAWQQR
jgi:hypothetical protein